MRVLEELLLLARQSLLLQTEEQRGTLLVIAAVEMVRAARVGHILAAIAEVKMGGLALKQELSTIIKVVEVETQEGLVEMVANPWAQEF